MDEAHIISCTPSLYSIYSLHASTYIRSCATKDFKRFDFLRCADRRDIAFAWLQPSFQTTAGEVVLCTLTFTSFGGYAFLPTRFRLRHGPPLAALLFGAYVPICGPYMLVYHSVIPPYISPCLSVFEPSSLPKSVSLFVSSFVSLFVYVISLFSLRAFSN